MVIAGGSEALIFPGSMVAHGTATRIGDAVECEALASVWGAELQSPRVSSTQALHGHLLGSAGALEAAITVMTLHERRLPPNSHCTASDPTCSVPLVPDGGIEVAALNAAIGSSFAFGGTNSTLLFTRV